MTDEIKPCPFCGGINISTEIIDFRRRAVAICNDCDARGPEVRLTALDDHPIDTSDALREWNTRVNPEHLSKGPTPAEF